LISKKDLALHVCKAGENRPPLKNYNMEFVDCLSIIEFNFDRNYISRKRKVQPSMSTTIGNIWTLY